MTVFTLAIEAPLAIIRIERPHARNAIPVAGWQSLAALCDAIRQSDARVVLLYSPVNGIFSAGADITEFPALRSDPAKRVAFREAMAAGIEAVADLPMPVIAAVDGGCFGAAVALVLACDICIAGDGASFATTPARLGLSYPAKDIARLEQRVGRGMSALMLFSGEAIASDRAHAIGLADVRAASAKAEGHTLAGSIAANASDAVAALKCVLRDPAAPGHAERFDERFASEAFDERMTAFLNRKAK
ncbi:enoyl-CoA hydratase/isomerase family protein [Stakelama sp. CBK3Z-3]|uniref:Enoyl-CoA hydratase/isomerase family protein n=1 Tax=Stakelama flava TaxID=2860338 RepID=A0ABS6XPB9_9SPHN|nr:enoyl-CoA hydratase/isomerase family protein [Stakelama flava]